MGTEVYSVYDVDRGDPRRCGEAEGEIRKNRKRQGKKGDITV